jgi:hypothetical protein
MPRTLEVETKTKHYSTSHISAKTTKHLNLQLAGLVSCLSLHFEEFRIPAQVAIRLSSEKYIHWKLKGH